MPRKRRLDLPGLVHHASVRGVDGELIFRDDEDRIGYRAMLAATVSRQGWLCLAYCGMGTHVHLLVETPEPNFSDGMRWLHGHYGRCFNKQHDRDGHLFQGRFHDEPVLTEAHLVTVVGYIAANPVEAGLCRAPEDWPWSSYRAVMGGTAPPWMGRAPLVGRVGAITGTREAYERIVAARLRPY